ncbi:MAG: RlmE family RNA methyltransferase [Paracoccaceae bacterium]
MKKKYSLKKNNQKISALVKKTKKNTDRSLKVNIKTAKGRKLSSTNWLRRQLNDPYVKLAKEKGYRSRAAFKLLEINEKFNILKFGDCVIDLGCAPGGWSQVAVEKTNANLDQLNKKKGRVIGIDLKPILSVSGAEILVLDFLETNFEEKIGEILNYKVDNVLSDMASNSTGHKKSDHLRIMALCESAAFFAFNILNEGGNFVSKVLAGGAEMELQNILKKKFDKVINFKPKSSRSDSSEKYVVALNFKKD